MSDKNTIVESFTLNGEIVVKTGEFLGFEIFEKGDGSDEKDVYFVKNQSGKRTVQGRIFVRAGCSQNYGFIDEFSIREIKS